MSWDLEDRVRTTLADRADEVGLPSFNSDDAVLRGRTARRHRRAIGVVTAAVGVVAVLLFGTSLIRPHTSAQPPARPAPSRVEPSPVEPSPPSSASLPSELAGLKIGGSFWWSLLVGNEIRPPDGPPVKIPLARGLVATRASQVPGGWVVESAPVQGPPDTAWFLTTSGELRKLVKSELLVIAPDGRRIAVAEHGTTLSLRALPSGKVLAQTRYEVGFGPKPVGIVGDRVIVDAVQGGGGSTDLAVWNTRSNVITRAAEHPSGGTELQHIGHSVDGRTVLLGVGSKAEGERRCLTVVPLTDRLRKGRLSCDVFLPEVGPLSPAGLRLAATRPDSRGNFRLESIDVAQIRSGPVKPVPLGLAPNVDASPLHWETEDVLIVRVRIPTPADGVDRFVLLRCHRAGYACERLRLPVPHVGVEPIVHRYGV